MALREELIRQEKLEQLAARFNRKAGMRETWLSENQRLGMISHKMSLITIFGHKPFRQKFHQNLTFFKKKFQQPLILVHVWFQISNFEAKLPQK